MGKSSEINVEKEPPNLLKNLKLLHPAYTHYHITTLPHYPQTNKGKEIEDLRNQIKLLKQNQRQHDTQKKPKHTENKEEHSEPKKHPGSFRPGGDTRTNIDFLKVLIFFQEIMETRSKYSQ